jgi:hypothetical protein
LEVVRYRRHTVSRDTISIVVPNLKARPDRSRHNPLSPFCQVRLTPPFSVAHPQPQRQPTAINGSLTSPGPATITIPTWACQPALPTSSPPALANPSRPTGQAQGQPRPCSTMARQTELTWARIMEYSKESWGTDLTGLANLSGLPKTLPYSGSWPLLTFCQKIQSFCTVLNPCV